MPLFGENTAINLKMVDLIKRPIVIQDLINHATYISLNNLDAGVGPQGRSLTIALFMLPKPLLDGLLNYLELAKSVASAIQNWLKSVNTPSKDLVNTSFFIKSSPTQ